MSTNEDIYSYPISNVKENVVYTINFQCFLYPISNAMDSLGQDYIAPLIQPFHDMYGK
jgi:hypothetical protein